ncbi:MAG: tetratricopeptide repeat protein [Deltaproteobacteria bacterium]|nr:tetratricopeptide repeat protein [Deltaproteobacteria bacterium]
MLTLFALQMTSCAPAPTALNHHLNVPSSDALQKTKENLIEQDAVKPILSPRDLFLNGYQSYQSNDFAATVYFFEQIPDSYMLSDYALYYKANALASLNRHYEALLSLDRIAKEYQDSPLFPFALLKIGGIFLNTADYQKAAEYFQRIIDKFPNHKETPQALYNLAVCLENTGKDADAQNILKQLWIEYPTDRYTKSTFKPILTMDETYKQIQNLFKLGEYKTVIKETLDLKENRFVMMNAKSSYYTKDYDGAIKNLKIILGNAPNNRIDNKIKEEALFWLGKSYANIKDTEKALAAYKEVLNSFSKGSYADEAIYRASILTKEQGDTASAIEMLEKLIKEYPSSQFRDEGIWQIAWINYENGEHKKAEKYLKSLEKTSSDRFRKRAIYWQGKVLLKLGNKDKAAEAFKKLSPEKQDNSAPDILPDILSDMLPSYYGMLAKKALYDLGIDKNADIEYQPQTVSFNPLETENLHIKRAYELLAINLKEHAYMELESLNSKSSIDALIHAGIIYKNSGSIHRSYNIGRSLLRNSSRVSIPYPELSTLLSIAHPLGYKNIVDEAAAAQQIDPYIVYAVITQESAFNETAVSRAGALGLMQIMPKTGKAVAEKLYGNAFKKEDLFLPEINITLGARYLKELMEEFKNNTVLALAAYNAGPQAVKSWLKKRDYYDADDGTDKNFSKHYAIDEFVENIPYQETRRYVEQVLSAYGAYKSIYGQELPFAKNKTAP